MARHSRTWWGKRFIAALESFCDPARLSRGRSYAGNDRILSFAVKDGLVEATVRGSINPYFGVHKEPRYTTTIHLTPITESGWQTIIAELAGQASTVIRLLLGEVPEDIESAFEPLDESLLPQGTGDFRTRCSCPDYANPCKHIAGLCYRLAAELDHQPLLLFELRGLSRDELHRQLRLSPLGQVLATSLEASTSAPEPSLSYYTRPRPLTLPADLSAAVFWQGSKRFSGQLESPTPTPVPGILVKTQGDYPPFWDRDNSFLEVMDQIYERARSKNQDAL